MLELLEWPSESKGHRVEFSQVRHNSVSIFRELSFFLPIISKETQTEQFIGNKLQVQKTVISNQNLSTIQKCSLKYSFNPLTPFRFEPTPEISERSDRLLVEDCLHLIEKIEHPFLKLVILIWLTYKFLPTTRSFKKPTNIVFLTMIGGYATSFCGI